MMSLDEAGSLAVEDSPWGRVAQKPKSCWPRHPLSDTTSPPPPKIFSSSDSART